MDTCFLGSTSTWEDKNINICSTVTFVNWYEFWSKLIYFNDKYWAILTQLDGFRFMFPYQISDLIMKTHIS